MKVVGTITEIKSRMSAMGDVVQTLKLEVHGEFASLHALQGKPLEITLVDTEI